MTPASDDDPKRSPWLSIWFRPGDTIERFVAVRAATGSVLLLAGLGMAASWVGLAIDFGLLTALLDWRNLAGIILVGLIAGVASLLFNAFFIRACPQLSRMIAATNWTAARKFRASLSYRVAIAR